MKPISKTFAAHTSPRRPWVACAALSVGALGLGYAAHADDYDAAAANASTAQMNQVDSNVLRNEAVSIKPMVGALAYTDAVGNSTSRGAAGLAVDMNLASVFADKNDVWKGFYLGPSTGVIYSHTGPAASNFFGDSSSLTGGSSGSNLVLIPIDLKVGYDITDNIRVAAHGGGNAIYRSDIGSMYFGSNSGTNWSIYPNVGGDVDLGLAPRLTAFIRPDVTLTPGNTLFSGMIGVGLLLG